MAKMTKQHFQFIADVILDTRSQPGLPAEREAARRMMYRFADELKATNPAFDRERFFTACGGHILGDENA